MYFFFNTDGEGSYHFASLIRQNNLSIKAVCDEYLYWIMDHDKHNFDICLILKNASYVYNLLEKEKDAEKNIGELINLSMGPTNKRNLSKKDTWHMF